MEHRLTNPPAAPAARDARPAFVIGITGHMEISPANRQIVEERITRVFQSLQKQQPRKAAARPQTPEEQLTGVALGGTPVILLSALAPGADQIAARCALRLGIRVICPLPFPLPFYRNSSTFRVTRENGLDLATVTAPDPEGAPPEKREHGLPVIGPESRRRHDELDELLAPGGVHPDDLFHVLHADDTALDEVALQEKLAADLRDRVGRNLRYRAAGDYISAYSDILIAVCSLEHPPDKPPVDETAPVEKRLPAHAEPGANRIVWSHLHGIDPGILPVGTALTWADNGPVVRIYCPNAKKQAPDGAEAPLITGDTAIWHPRDCTIPGEPGEVRHRREMTSLGEFARNFRDLLAEFPREYTSKHHAEAASLLKAKSPFRPHNCLGRLRQRLSGAFAKIKNEGYRKWLAGLRIKDPPAPAAGGDSNLPAPLHRIGIARRVIADLNSKYDAKVKRLMAHLFAVTAGVVLFQQLFENWVTPGTAEPPPAVWRQYCFLAALLLFFGGFLYYWLRTRHRLLEKLNDYRAISEGLRVQYYWSAAGLGLSAASEYLQHVRSSLSWIRSAMASVSFPYEESRREFQRLDTAQQLERLRRVCEGWSSGQEAYFSEKAHSQTLQHHRLHFAGNLLLVAGLAVITGNFLLEATHDKAAPEHIPAWIHAWAWQPLVFWLFAAAALWLAAQVITLFAWRAGEKAGALSGADSGSGFWMQASSWLHRSLHWSVAWLAGLALGTAVFVAIYSPPAQDWLPEGIKRGAVAKSFLLAAGGLLHAWAAFKFSKENSRRYTAMRDLFRAAQTKFRHLLAHAENQRKESRPAEEVNATITSIQQLLGALGREAIHENTYWLLMHRNKPVEPVPPIA